MRLDMSEMPHSQDRLILRLGGLHSRFFADNLYLMHYYGNRNKIKRM